MNESWQKRENSFCQLFCYEIFAVPENCNSRNFCRFFATVVVALSQSIVMHAMAMAAMIEELTVLDTVPRSSKRPLFR